MLLIANDRDCVKTKIYHYFFVIFRYRHLGRFSATPITLFPVKHAHQWQIAIIAIAPNDIWAIGNDVAHGEQTLAEHWNGTSWTIVAAPDSFLMNDAAAVASNYVWAVGWMISSSIIQH